MFLVIGVFKWEHQGTATADRDQRSSIGGQSGYCAVVIEAKPSLSCGEAWFRRVSNRVLRGARIRTGQRVLDIGAGTGLLALGAASRVGQSGSVFALDISRDALIACLSQAHTQSAPVCAVVGEATGLPFDEGSFDAVLTRSVLIYVSDKLQAITEMFRVLRPGGRASIWERSTTLPGAMA